MAELASTAREYDKAINFYKEGLTYDETYVPVWSYGIVTELGTFTVFALYESWHQCFRGHAGI